MTEIEKGPNAWLVTTEYGAFVAVEPHTHPWWESDANAVHHAEPLYTLPNALRVLADDRSLVDHLFQLGVDQRLDFMGALRVFIEEIVNPAPPIPPEPTGDVRVLDSTGGWWREDDGAWWHNGYGRMWPELVREFGPLKVYEARP